MQATVRHWCGSAGSLQLGRPCTGSHPYPLFVRGYPHPELVYRGCVPGKALPLPLSMHAQVPQLPEPQAHGHQQEASLLPLSHHRDQAQERRKAAHSPLLLLHLLCRGSKQHPQEMQ